MPLILFTDNAKIRLSERNGNLFTFPSVRILSKPSGEYDFIDNEIFRIHLFFILRCRLSYSQIMQKSD